MHKFMPQNNKNFFAYPRKILACPVYDGYTPGRNCRDEAKKKSDEKKLIGYGT